MIARRFALTLCLILAACSAASAQAPSGRNEVDTGEPALEGRSANAPIPSEFHIKNEGGSDGAGLCVISSVLANGSYQGVPGLEGGAGEAGKQSTLWRTAKSRPGGYYPEKLAELVDEVMPGEGYASFLDTDPAVLDRLSKMGYAIGLTMNTGELYDWQKISHMVSNVHFDWANDLACHVDNNRPGVYVWTTAKETLRRAIDGAAGEYWAWIWTRLPDVAGAAAEQPLVVLFLAGALVILAYARRTRLAAA